MVVLNMTRDTTALAPASPSGAALGKPAEPMISIRHVTQRFGRSVVAVDDVSLDIKEGEFITLLGPSGCGKTTLLRMLAGFGTPSEGSILMAGKDVTALPPYSRDVNMVFQDYALFPHLTVARNVAFGLDRMGVARARRDAMVAESLAMVGLGDKADRRPDQLSGGQRQRVALARALVRGPRVLLLDEPLSALDAGLREAMQVELKKLHKQLGITFVMVTHDQTEALAMSDRIVVMYQGRVAQVGTPSDLYHRPASRYVASFIGTTNFFEGTVTATSSRETQVLCGAISFVCPPRSDLRRGETVTLGIRPENLLRETATAAVDVPNGLACQVQDQLFHGNRTRFRLTGPNGEEIYWDWQSPDGETQAPAGLEPGAPLRLSARQADIMVFAQDAQP